MATTIIKDGRLLRRTKTMPTRRAIAFARALIANPDHPAESATVVAANGRKACVEFAPAKTTEARLIEQAQVARAQRAVDVRRYSWRRIGRRLWKCRGLAGQEYLVNLDSSHCSCPDWGRIRSVGGECKHLICAREAERRFQESHAPARIAAPSSDPDLLFQRI